MSSRRQEAVGLKKKELLSDKRRLLMQPPIDEKRVLGRPESRARCARREAVVDP
jgi:hypothetical protein